MPLKLFVILVAFAVSGYLVLGPFSVEAGPPPPPPRCLNCTI